MTINSDDFGIYKIDGNGNKRKATDIKYGTSKIFSAFVTNNSCSLSQVYRDPNIDIEIETIEFTDSPSIFSFTPPCNILVDWGDNSVGQYNKNATNCSHNYGIGKSYVCCIYYLDSTFKGTPSFEENEQIQSVSLGNKVTSIGESAFKSCSSLEVVTIGDSVTSIGSNAFNGCTSLTSVTIGDGVANIGAWAFIACRELTSVTIGNSVTSIRDSAFQDCSSLTSVTIPNSVTSIERHAFFSCSSLTSATIGNGVTSIGSEAFFSCSLLKNIYYTGTIDSWCEINFRDNFANPLYYAQNLYINNELVTTANITTATKINSCAFYKYSSLTSATIGNSVASIGNDAFHYCSSLASVMIGDSVTSIGEWAFSNCSLLTNITFPNNNLNIGREAFSTCTSLGKITIPNSIQSIGEDAFIGCPIKEAVIPMSVCNSFPHNVLESLEITKGNISGGNFNAYGIIGLPNLLYLTLSADVGNISNYAFDRDTGFASLKRVYVSSDAAISRIGEFAFQNCPIEELIINKTEGIGVYATAFSGTRIKDAKISISLYRIVETPQKDTTKYLTSLTILDGTSKGSFDNDAFKDFTELTSLSIGNSVTSIKQGAFSGCSSLTNVTIGDSVTSIGEDDVIGQTGTFSGCSSLTSITIPNSVTSIGQAAFSGCSSLEEITIGNSITNVGMWVFNNCPIKTANIPAILCRSIGSIEINDRCPIITLNITGGTEIAAYSFYMGDYLAFKKLSICNTVNIIGQSAFSGATGLTNGNVTFEGTVEQWENNVTKGSHWMYTRVKYITCSDGDAPVNS